MRRRIGSWILYILIVCILLSLRVQGEGFQISSSKIFICTNMKDEHKYIDEFLIYYLYGLKIDKIYIYDNSDDNNLRDYQSRHNERVDVKHIPGKAKKFDAYNDFLARMKALPIEDRPKWVFFPDTDEFLVLTPEREIHEYLASECKDGGINIYWYIFGSNGRKNYSPEPVTARFTKRAKDRHPLYKTIAVLEDVERITHLMTIPTKLESRLALLKMRVFIIILENL